MYKVSLFNKTLLVELRTYRGDVNVIILSQRVNQRLHGPLHDGESLAMDAATPEQETRSERREARDENTNRDHSDEPTQAYKESLAMDTATSE